MYRSLDVVWVCNNGNTLETIPSIEASTNCAEVIFMCLYYILWGYKIVERTANIV